MTFEEPLWESHSARSDRFSLGQGEWPPEDDWGEEPEDETCTLVFQVPLDVIQQQELRLLAGQIGCVALSVFRRVADDMQ